MISDLGPGEAGVLLLALDRDNPIVILVREGTPCLFSHEFMPHNLDMQHLELESILCELSEALRDRYRERFVGLWLYGSQARGDAGPDSDIDLLLILTQSERPAVEVDRYSDILAEFNLCYGVLLSVLPVEQSELRDASGPFWRNVRAEGIAA